MASPLEGWDEEWESGDAELTSEQAARLAAWYRRGQPEDDPPADGAWDGVPQQEFLGAPGPEPEPGPLPPPELARLIRRRPGRGGGFGAGGIADAIPPGPVLAGLAADRQCGGLGTVTDDELAGLMIAWRRIASWATAGEWAAIAELDRRRAAAVAAGADCHLAEHVCDEIAMALTLTPRAAEALVDRAVGLDRLPLTFAALTAGQIDAPRAMVIMAELSGLDDRHAAVVEKQVIGAAAQQTTGQLRRAARRAVIAADPAAARRRKERALRGARVERWAEDSGTAALAGRDLPPAQTLAADACLTQWAQRLKRAGIPGSLDQLRARVYLALLNGQRAESLLPAAPADGNGAAPAGSSPAGGSPAGPAADGPRGGPPDSGSSPPSATPAGLTARGSVNLVLPLATWLGWSSSPGEAAGFGPLDADDSRALANALARDPATAWCITITGPDGRAVAHGCAKTGPGEPSPQAAPPGWPPGPVPGGGPPGGGPPGGGPPGGGPPGGGPPGDGPRGGGPPGGGQVPADHPPPAVRAWLDGVALEWLETGRCTHRREAPGYRPTRRLAHLIQIRHRTCTAPGCSRPATTCDFEHAIAYQQGGRTCECTCHPCCRRHHRAKQAGGWLLAQPRPGVLVWHTPHGRSYTTLPDPYPV